MKTRSMVNAVYRKIPIIIAQDARELVYTIFPGHNPKLERNLEDLIKSLRKDMSCWSMMLHRGIMTEEDLYRPLQSKKTQLVLVSLAANNLDAELLQLFADRLVESIYITIVSSSQLFVTTDNILSLLLTFAIR